jgi:hypothetical protein
MTDVQSIPKDATHMMYITCKKSQDTAKIHAALDNKKYKLGTSDIPYFVQWTFLGYGPLGMTYTTTTRMASNFLEADMTKIMKRVPAQFHFTVAKIVARQTIV